MVSPPIPFCEVKNGIKRITAQIRFDDWFEARKKEIIAVVRDKGQMYDQRA
jgi:hypothetical protein